MIIYPAIDLRGGKCVRLIQGDFSRETIYLENPVEAARQWQNQGANWIHVVDLDGAKSGIPGNIDTIMRIRAAVNINIQVGGGIRNDETVEKYLKGGINRIIFGSAAIESLPLIENTINIYGSQRVAVGVDMRKNQVAIQGWTKTSNVVLDKMLSKLEDIGVKTIIYTDISRDGMMKGPNIDGLEKVLSFGDFSVIASGGISTMADFDMLVPFKEQGLEGAIIGKALYSGVLELKAILKRFSLQDRGV